MVTIVKVSTGQGSQKINCNVPLEFIGAYFYLLFLLLWVFKGLRCAPSSRRCILVGLQICALSCYYIPATMIERSNDSLARMILILFCRTDYRMKLRLSR